VPLPVAVLVIGLAAAGAETGNDDPSTAEPGAAELPLAAGVVAVGALSVGGAASMVSPPDDFVAPEDPSAPEDPVEDELWLLEDDSDGAEPTGEETVPSGLATAVAGPWVGTAAAPAAVFEESEEDDELPDESDPLLTSALLPESESPELSFPFSDPPLPFLLGASVLCSDSGVVCPNSGVSRLGSTE
jgi:hypothetical protein